MTAGALSTVEDLPCLDAWAALSQKISEEAQKRNRIAHFGLTSRTDKKGKTKISVEPYLSVFPKKKSTTWVNLNKNDVFKFGKDWDVLAESLNEFLTKLQKHRKLTK